MAKVSIVLPIYNTAKYLEQCLESVRNQTLRDIQIICVDDGSSDDSVAIAERFVKTDARMQLIINKHEGEGAASARNAGLAVAIGEYVLVLDTDDWFEPTLVEIAYNTAKEQNAEVVLYSAAWYNDAAGMYINTPSNVLDKNYLPEESPFSPGEVAECLFQLTIGPAWLKLISNDLIRRTGIRFQSNYYIDDQFFSYAAMASAKKIAYADQKLVHYRMERKGGQTDTKEKNPLAAVRFATKLKEFLAGQGMLDEYRSSFLHRLLWLTVSRLKDFQTYEAFHTLFEATHSEEFVGLLGADWESCLRCIPQELKGRDILLGKREQLICETTEILKYTEAEFLFQRKQEAGKRPYNFPLDKVQSSDRVILYGAGKAGRCLFGENAEKHYCNIVAWTDGRGSAAGFPVVDVQEALRRPYDKILIAVSVEYMVREIEEKLRQFGVKDEVIIRI